MTRRSGTLLFFVLLACFALAVPVGCARAPQEASKEQQGQEQQQHAPATAQDADEPNRAEEAAEEASSQTTVVQVPAAVWVMRHGEDAGPERALTARGQQQAAEAAKQFTSMEGLVIWTSPRLRCMQTARIVHELVPESRLVVQDWLDYHQPLPADWRDRLEQGPLLLVTHQPVVSRMLSDLGHSVPSVTHAFVARLQEPR